MSLENSSSINDLRTRLEYFRSEKKKTRPARTCETPSIAGSDGSKRRLSKCFKYIRFIIISTMKLQSSDLTLATASTIFHKFFKKCKLEDFDPYLIATSCIYLASKIEEDQLKLRDIINVCYRTLHSHLEPLQLDEKYWALRSSVIQIELLIVRVLDFDLEFEHPHKYLLIYLESLRHWISLDTRRTAPVIEVSWSMLRDSLHSDFLLGFRPQEVALAILYLVCMIYGIKVAYNEQAEKTWWRALDDRTSKSTIHEIIDEILELYDYESQLDEIKFTKI